MENLRARVQAHFGAPPVLTGSGSAAFALILEALKQTYGRTEVVLPAYTVPGLHVVVRKAGLVTRLCDVDPTTLSYDVGALERVANDRTLAILAVHLFGLPTEVEPTLRVAEGRGAVVIEDAAQAVGSRLKGTWVGARGTAAFFSFERGKSLSAYGGGCALAHSADLRRRLKGLEEGLPPRPWLDSMAAPFLVLGLSLATRPWIYGGGYSILRHFKSTRRHEDLYYFAMDSWRASLLDRLWERQDLEHYRRMMNGRYLHAWLGSLKGVRVPQIAPDGYPAFTRLPVIVESLEKVEAVREDLWRVGIDAVVMFPRPVHHVYPEFIPAVGGTFPRAEWLAPRLITLPVHSHVRPADLERMVRVFERHFG